MPTSGLVIFLLKQQRSSGGRGMGQGLGMEQNTIPWPVTSIVGTCPNPKPGSMTLAANTLISSLGPST